MWHERHKKNMINYTVQTVKIIFLKKTTIYLDITLNNSNNDKKKKRRKNKFHHSICNFVKMNLLMFLLF